MTIDPNDPPLAWIDASASSNVLNEGETSGPLAIVIHKAEPGMVLQVQEFGYLAQSGQLVTPVREVIKAALPSVGCDVWSEYPGIGLLEIYIRNGGSFSIPFTFTVANDLTTESVDDAGWMPGNQQQLNIKVATRPTDTSAVGMPVDNNRATASFWATDTSLSTPFALPSLGTTLPAAIRYSGSVHGLNISSAEAAFADWHEYPQHGYIDALTGLGAKIIRVPFAASRVAGQSGSSVVLTKEITDLASTASYITSKGAWALLDLHEYGNTPAGGLETDQGGVWFASFWRAMADKFKTDPKVAFCLMNEPVNPSGTQVVAAYNLALKHIRDAGFGGPVHPMPTHWGGAHAFTQNDNAGAFTSLVDPINNVVIEMHQYLDETTGFGGYHFADSDITTRSVAAIIGPATQWLRDNNRQGFIGEWAFGTSTAWVAKGTEMRDYLTANSDVWIGTSYWTSGAYDSSYEWWPGNFGTEGRPQMPVLQALFNPQAAPAAVVITVPLNAFPSGLVATSFNASYAEVTDSSVATIVNNRLRLTNSTGHTFAFAGFPVSGFTAGTTYQVSVPYVGGGNGRPAIDVKASETAITSLASSGDLTDNASGTYTATFVAPGSTVWVDVGNDRSSASYVDFESATFTPVISTLTFDALPTGLKPTSFNASGQEVADASVASIVNGRLRIASAPGHTYPFVGFPMSGLTTGQVYQFSGDYVGGANGRPYIGITASETESAVLLESGDLPDNSSGTFTGSFRAPGPTVWISCGNDRSLVNSGVDYDNFALTKAPPVAKITFDALPSGLVATSFDASGAAVTDSSVATIVGGRLRIAGSSGHTYPFVGFPVSGFTAGQTYQFSGEYTGGGNGRPCLGISASNTASTSLLSSGDLPDNSSGTFTGTFTAPGPTVWVSVGNDRSAASSVDFDNFVFEVV